MHGLVGTYIESSIITAILYIIGGIVFLILPVFWEEIEKSLFIFPCMVCIAFYHLIKALTVYYPVYKETKNIHPKKAEEDNIYITKIRKTHHSVSKTTRRISFYTIYFRKGNEKGTYYYIPLELHNQELEKLKNQDICVSVYEGTKIIKSYSPKDGKAHISSRSLITKAKENTSGLWAEILEVLETGKFETLWSSDIVVEYCLLNVCGDMIDISLNNNGDVVCFNLDQDSIYVSYPQSNRDETAALSDFADIDALLSYMQKCADSIP